MRKKMIALVMTAVLAVSSVLTVGATAVLTSPTATTAEITSASDGDGNEVLYFSSEEEAEAYYEEHPEATEEDGGYGYLVVTDSTVAPDMSDENVQELVQEIIDAESLIHVSTGESVEVGDVSVHSLFEVYWVDKGVAENPPYVLTFEVPGVTADNFVDVLSLNEETGEWERHEAVAGDGYVTATFTHFCYVAILVSSTETEDETTTTASSGDDTTTTTASGSSDNTSQETGDISLVVPIALLVVAGVAIVVLIAKGRKKEAE